MAIMLAATAQPATESPIGWFAANKDALAGIASAGTIIGTILALVIFERGRRQYHQAESWKRTEFLARLYKDFWDDPACRRAIMMLDGAKREICFEDGGSVTPFEQHHLCNALRAANPEQPFTPYEFQIRDSMDRFFIYLEQFDRLIGTGLVKKEQVYPYFAYWIDQLNGAGAAGGLDDQVRKSVNQYLRDCNFSNVTQFLARWPSPEKSASG